MNSPIITTTQAARLLGVSPRTAQLWIESGLIPSWKTPGGHRRMFEKDVLAKLEAGGETRTVARRVLVLAPAREHARWERALAALDVEEAGCVDNAVAAAVALGASPPDVLAIQVDGPGELAPRFLALLRQVPLLSRLHIVIASSLPAEALAPLLDAGARLDFMRLGGGPDDLARELLRQTALQPLKLQPLPVALRDAAFPVGADEARRLAAVHRSGILDSAPEEEMDDIVRLAALSLAAPVALLTVLSEDRQWFKARVGLELRETPRDWAFCNYTVMHGGLQEFPALDSDPRFAANPAVAGAPHFRYYAGAPVTDDQGFALGSLCIIDTRPRMLDAAQAEILGRLARQASSEIVRRLRGRRR